MAQRSDFKNVKVRRETYQKLLDLQAEISAKRGYKVTISELLTAAVEFVDRLESMRNEDDIAGFHGSTEGK